MHPVLARYLDPDLTRELLRRIDAGEDLGSEHHHLSDIAREWADERREILDAPESLPPLAQSALLFLATHAALRASREDPLLGPAIAEADEALRKLGAAQGESDALFAQLVAEEAFGTEEDPESFDAEWIREGLRDLPRLVALDEAQVQALLDEFVARTSGPAARHRVRAARLLLESAWGDGMALINVEHVEEALSGLEQAFGEDEVPRAALALQEFVFFLHERGLMGKLRSQHLGRAVGLSTMSPPGGYA
jgi:hypothetical protein